MSMTLEQHRLCGRLLAYANGGKITGPLNSVRSTLDDWVYVEQMREMTHADISAIYYGHHRQLPHKPSATEYADAIAGVEQVRGLLILHYSARAKKLLVKLDGALALLRRRGARASGGAQ